MIVKIILELIIAIIIIIAGTTFWMLLKRDRFLARAMQDDKLIVCLQTFLDTSALFKFAT
jgi:hypothetical protein